MSQSFSRIIFFGCLATISFVGGKYAVKFYHEFQQKKELKEQFSGNWTDVADKSCHFTLNEDNTMYSSVKSYAKWDLHIKENTTFLILQSPTVSDTLEIILFNPTMLVLKQHERTNVFERK